MKRRKTGTGKLVPGCGVSEREEWRELQRFARKRRRKEHNNQFLIIKSKSKKSGEGDND